MGITFLRGAVTGIVAGTNTATGPGVVFSNANGVTIGLTGNTATFSTGQGTLTNYEPYPSAHASSSVLSAGTNTSAPAYFIPFDVTAPVAAGVIIIAQNMAFQTVGTSSGRQSLTMSYGLYSRGTGTNNSTLSVLTSGSYGISVTGNNSSYTINQPTSTDTAGYTTNTTASAGVNISSAYTGGKMVQLPISSIMTPGRYWLGLFGRASTSSINVGVLYSFIGANIGGTLAGMAPIGSFSTGFSTGTNATRFIGGNWYPNLGSFSSAAQTNLPNTVALSAFTMGAAMGCLPHIRLVSI